MKAQSCDPTSGEGEIRTHGPVNETAVFKTAALGHYATSPSFVIIAVFVLLSRLLSPKEMLSDFLLLLDLTIQLFPFPNRDRLYLRKHTPLRNNKRFFYAFPHSFRRKKQPRLGALIFSPKPRFPL